MIRVLLILLALATPVAAQVADPSAPSTPSGAISTQDNRATDLAILSRISSILAQVPEFDGVRASVDAGIVTLVGEVTEQQTISRLESLLARVEGVVAIEDQVTLSTDPVSYTHLRAHETGRNLVCRLLLEKKKKK